MTEGHPASSPTTAGSASALDDYARYAPETGRPSGCLARRRAGRSHLALGARPRRGRALRATSSARRRCDRLRARAARPRPRTRPTTSTCPVHPWQWGHKLAITFAADVARRDLVLARRRATTTTARSSRSARSSTPAAPTRHYVKTALSIQNMGFMRGPVAGLHGGHAGDQRLGRRPGQRRRDPARRAASRCCASARRSATPGDAYHRHAAARRRTARCSPRCGARARCRGSAPGERLATMASLLHRDADGARSPPR